MGLSTLVAAAAGDEWTLFARFGTWQAMASFAAIALSALAGLHPIIGVSVLASILDLSGGEQTLFAFVALSAWAVGTSVGPLSGINLSLQGRYGGERLPHDERQPALRGDDEPALAGGDRRLERLAGLTIRFQ